jgi:hypothetical protein
MKAIDIINFINEDKFSKYTLQQIYDELDEEDFFDYLSKCALKIIKTLDEKFKAVKPKIIKDAYNYLIVSCYEGRDGFELKYSDNSNTLFIQCHYNKFMVFGKDIKGDEPNFSTRLKEELTRCFNRVKDKK